MGVARKNVGCCTGSTNAPQHAPTTVVETRRTTGGRMVSRVTYRPFDEDDFEDIATILQEAWHTEVPSPEYGYLEACNDLSYSPLHLVVFPGGACRRRPARHCARASRGKPRAAEQALVHHIGRLFPPHARARARGRRVVLAKRRAHGHQERQSTQSDPLQHRGERDHATRGERISARHGHWQRAHRRGNGIPCRRGAPTARSSTPTPTAPGSSTRTTALSEPARTAARARSAACSLASCTSTGWI